MSPLLAHWDGIPRDSGDYPVIPVTAFAPAPLRC